MIIRAFHVSGCHQLGVIGYLAGCAPIHRTELTALEPAFTGKADPGKAFYRFHQLAVRKRDAFFSRGVRTIGASRKI